MSITKKLFVSAFVAAFTLVVATTQAAYVQTTTLKLGSRGAQVVALQQTLNMTSCKVAVSGAGSPGMESSVFGPKTAAAVKCFQAMHPETGKADGVVGHLTGLALAAVTGNPATGGTPTGTCPAGYVCTPTGSNSGSTLSGGETSITNATVNNADNTTIQEGASKAEVAQIKFRVKDADAQLNRVDVLFTQGGSNSVVQPWKVFNKVYLQDDNGNTIGSMSSTSKSDWDETASGSGIYSIRLGSLNKVFKSGDTYTLHVAADLNSSIKGSDVIPNARWTLTVPSNGLRFIDGAGVDTTVSPTGNSVIDIETAGLSSKLTITEDSSSPAAGNINTSTSSATTETVGVFKIKADTNGGDVKIDDFPVTIKLQSAGSGKLFSDVISDVYLKLNGKTYTGTPAVALTGVTANGTSTVKFNFDDLSNDNVVVDAGSSTTATIQVKFRSQGQSAVNYANGTLVTAATALTSANFEDSASGDAIGSFTPSGGIVTAENMGLYSTGIQVALVSTDKNVTVGSGNNDDMGTFTIKFKVTAFGDTVYIPDVASSTTAANAILFTVNGTAPTSVSGVVVDNTDSTLSSGGNFAVDEGSSETFTLTVSTKDGTAGLYNTVLNNVRWNTTDSNATYSDYTSNLDSFKTDYVSLN